MRTGRRGLLGLAAAGVVTPVVGAPRPDRKQGMPPGVTVETHRGKVRGGVDDGIKVFKGIAYAAPTGGLNRFRPPKPAPVWSDVRDAVAYGPMCPQLTAEQCRLGRR